MPQNNLFDGADAPAIGIRVIRFVQLPPPPQQRDDLDARKYGVRYVVEYETQGVSDAATTLADRKKVLDAVLARMFTVPGVAVQPQRFYTFKRMFEFFTDNIPGKHRDNLA